MASIPVSTEDNIEQTIPDEGGGRFIRVIVADSQAIFRAGLRKIFALEDDIRVVGQAETLSQALSAAKRFTADILIFEASLAPNPIDAVSELLRQAPKLRLVVITESSLARLSRNCSSNVCAKYPKASPGWIAVEFNGFWKHTARKERAPLHRVPKCS